MSLKIILAATLSIIMTVLCLCAYGKDGHAELKEVDEAKKMEVMQAYGKLPLRFIKNQGQVDDTVRFYVKGQQGTIYFTTDAIVYDLIKKQASEKNKPGTHPIESKTEPQNVSRLTFTVKMAGISNDAHIAGQDPLPGKVNYLTGSNRKDWQADIPTYATVLYQGLYDHIDLRIYGTNKEIEFDYLVQPGGNPQHIQFACEGIKDLAVDKEGNLIMETPLGSFKHMKPTMYQEIDGKKKTVTGGFTVDKNRYGFTVAAYDKAYPLIIR